MVLKRNNKKTMRKIKHKGSKKNKKNMRKSNRNKSSKKNVKKIKRTRKQMGGNAGSHKKLANQFLEITGPQSIIDKACGIGTNAKVEYLLKNLIKKEIPWMNIFDSIKKYRKHAYIENNLDKHSNLTDINYPDKNYQNQEYNKGEKLYFITSVNMIQYAEAPMSELSMYNCKKLSNYLKDLAGRLEKGFEDADVNKTIEQLDSTKDEMIKTIKFAVENLDKWPIKTQQ